MALSREDVVRLADLSRLALTEDELTRMEQTIDPVLDYVGRLSKVDTTGVPEAETFGGMMHELRVDEPTPSGEGVRSAILANFPDKTGDALRVPGVFENPKG